MWQSAVFSGVQIAERLLEEAALPFWLAVVQLGDAAVLEDPHAGVERPPRQEESGEGRWHRDEKGGSVYLRLSTRPLDQLIRPMTRELRESIIDGGYWLRRPEPGSELAIVYTSHVDGRVRRVSEHLCFDEGGLVMAGEVFHGVAGPTGS